MQTTAEHTKVEGNPSSLDFTEISKLYATTILLNVTKPKIKQYRFCQQICILFKDFEFSLRFEQNYFDSDLIKV